MLPSFADPAAGQLISGGSGLVAGPFGGQLGQGAFNLLPDPAERDPEHALAALQQVHDLVRGSALVHADAVAHQRDLSQVGRAALAQMGHRRPDLLQRDPRVEQALYYFKDENVTEAVQALRARASRRP